MIDINSGIYAITFAADEGDRIYIGSSINLANRKRHHISELKRGNHCNTHLQNCWNKYNSSFEWDVLEYCDKESIRHREQWWIDLYWGKQELLNFIPISIGGSMKGKHHTEETKKYLSEINKKRLRKPHSEETKAKLSKAFKGRYVPTGWRENISVGQTGKKHSKEWCEHISQARKGYKMSDEQKAKLSQIKKQAAAQKVVVAGGDK